MDKLGTALKEGDRVAFPVGETRLETGTVSAVLLPSIRIERDDTSSWLPRVWRNAAQCVKVATS